MSIPNCPYCGKKIIIGFVDIGGGDGGYAPVHENEEDGEACGMATVTFRTAEQAEIFFKKAVYYAEDY